MIDIKTVVDFFSQKGKIFKSIKQVDLKLLGSRKKIDIFSCVDPKSSYHIIFWVESKSRFLRSHALGVQELERKFTLLENHNNKYKHIYIEEAMCSKAKEELIQKGWKVYNGTV